MADINIPYAKRFEKYEQALVLWERFFDAEIGCTYHGPTDWPYCFFCEASLGHKRDKHKDDCVYIMAYQLLEIGAGE